MQSVFRSFFLRYGEETANLGGWDSLWGLLTTITVRKYGRRVSYYRRDRRDVRREVAPRAPASEDSFPQWEGMADGPNPAEAAELANTVEELLRGYDERDQMIVTLTLQGFSRAETAAKVPCSERTVQRVLNRTREKLKSL